MKINCQTCDMSFETDKNEYVCPGCGESLDKPCDIDLDAVFSQIQALRNEVENRFWCAYRHIPNWGRNLHGDFDIDSIEFSDLSGENVAVVTVSSDCGHGCCGVVTESLGIKREWMKMSLSEMTENLDKANQLARLEFEARQKKAQEDVKNAKMQSDLKELRRLLALYPIWGDSK